MAMSTPKKIWLSALAILVILVLAVHLLIPQLVLGRLNAYLENFSPVYKLHVNHLVLNVFRGAYRFEGVRGEIKANGQQFLDAGWIDVSIAWRELLHGRITTDIDVEETTAALTRELFDNSKDKPDDRKQEGKALSDKLFPLRIETVNFENCTIEFAEVANLPKELRWRLSAVDGKVSNLTATRRQPFAVISATGAMMGSSTVKIAAKVDRLVEPIDWEADVEMLHFDMVKANPLLLRLVPLDFGSGNMDLYLEAVSRAGTIDGYAKPFLHNLVVLQKGQRFKNARHVLAEFTAAILNLVLRTPSKKIVAAKIPFHRPAGGTVSVDKSTFVATILQNGFNGGIQPGIEDKFNLEFPHHSGVAFQHQRN